MADYDDLITIAGNGGFQNRVKYALIQAAVSVYNEQSSTTGHTARVAYASNVIAGNYNLAPTSLAVLTNSTLAAEATLTSAPDFNIPDTDLQFAVNSLWNAFANA
jgi:hypothetical protein